MSTKAKKTFELSRKEGADILKVSLRTLDRYVKSKKVSSKNIAGRVMLNKDEIVEMAKKKRKQRSIKKKPATQKKAASKIHIDDTVQKPAEEAFSIPVEHITTEAAKELPEFEMDEPDFKPEYAGPKKDSEEKVYKELYLEVKEETKKYQQKLEGANYRVGQLESQLESSVPLAEHQKLLTGHRQEKYNKKVLYILLGVLLAFQPVWIILAFL